MGICDIPLLNLTPMCWISSAQKQVSGFSVWIKRLIIAITIGLGVYIIMKVIKK